MTIIGIDLGTTNSAVAILKDGNAEIIPNKEGHRTTPSIFNITPQGEIVIGKVAKNYYAGAPEDTVLEIKRLMGTEETVTIRNQTFSPEEISSFYLKYLKECAEQFTGQQVSEAIITVPAYFSDAQRKATQIAGQIAGLSVERIINEPTAAAIAYGMEHFDDEAYVLVYDFGGGTFDVSVVEIFAGVVEVKASTGDNHLGGMDVDELLVKWLADKVKEIYDFSLLEDGNEAELKQRAARIKIEAENVKLALSTNTSAMFNLPFIAMKAGNPLSVSLEITRGQFEQLIAPLLQTTLEHVERALSMAAIDADDINEVLLIGGSTRIPAVQQLIEQKFNKEARKDINPDEAVAIGAAIGAAIKTGEINSADGLMIIDVCPYSLGIEISRTVDDEEQAGFYDELIPANTKVPAKRKKVYNTVYDDQTEVEVVIYQGKMNEERVNENLKISKEPLKIDGIPKGPKGFQTISILFEYDINGLLNIEAEIVSTGKIFNSVINAKTGAMSPVAISESVKKIEEKWDYSKLYSEIKQTLIEAEQLMLTSELEHNDEIAQLMIALQQAILEKQTVDLKMMYDQLQSLLMQNA